MHSMLLYEFFLIFELVSVAEHAGLRLTRSPTLKQDLLAVMHARIQKITSVGFLAGF